MRCQKTRFVAFRLLLLSHGDKLLFERANFYTCFENMTTLLTLVFVKVVLKVNIIFYHHILQYSARLQLQPCVTKCCVYISRPPTLTHV